MSTKLYFSEFILSTALTPFTAMSIIHPNTCKNLLGTLRFTSLSSTDNIRGGTTHLGTNINLLARSSTKWKASTLRLRLSSVQVQALVPQPRPLEVKRG